MSFTVTQSRLLNYLLPRAHAVRTDELAKHLGVQPNEVVHALLPLRNCGYLTTTADGQQHVIWTMTAAGRAAIVEWRREEEAKRNRVTYILWCPTSRVKAPQVTYPSLDKAKEVQKIMAERHPGHVFYVCEVGRGLKAENVTKYVEV